MAKPDKPESAGGGTGAKEVFVDTSGFLALLCTRDPAHAEAKRRVAAFARARRRVVTTDHVLNETFSLLKVRGLQQLCPQFQAMVQGSKVLRVVWTQPARFDQATGAFLTTLDQEGSFTDQVSFTVMREHGLTDALTTDPGFRVAGFKPLLLATT